jgi:hypothetical protein
VCEEYWDTGGPRVYDQVDRSSECDGVRFSSSETSGSSDISLFMHWLFKSSGDGVADGVLSLAVAPSGGDSGLPSLQAGVEDTPSGEKNTDAPETENSSPCSWGSLSSAAHSHPTVS